jgi:uncharacterized protein (PEP-CTERM system associated)
LFPSRIGPAPAVLKALGLATALVLVRTGDVAAFPFIGDENQGAQGTELTAPAILDLQHQLQLVNGLGAPAGGGWTFVPMLNWQEEVTDNVLNLHGPRVTDLVSFLAPGISIVGDLPRVQLNFNYSPVLSIYTETSRLNSLTEQLNGLGTITLAPDLLFVDVRAVAGVQSAYGGLGGAGTIGAPAGAGATAASAIPALGGNTAGLNKDNEFQTASFGISPYLLRQIGDYGTLKLGDSLNVTRSDQLSGFFASPLPTGGINGQTQVSNEENGHFVTGQFLEFFQDTFDADLVQTHSTQETTGTTVGGGASPHNVQTSTRAIITDQISYAISPSLTVFASGGHEDISYTNQGAQNAGGFVVRTGPDGQLLPPTFVFNNTGAPAIHDLTWSLGATWTPNPDSSLTVSYGHQNGFNSFTANGHYAATARTLLTVSYGSTLGTQLENLQNQLNAAGSNGTGTLVNGTTGGQLFGNINAQPLANGIFRTDTLTLGSTTSLDRDIISINLLLSKQTSSGTTTATSAQSKTASVSWLHEMNPDMTVSASISYAIQDQSTAFPTTFNPGNNTSLAASLAWQWQISETLSGSVRYSFFDRQSTDAAFTIYENIFIVGLSKHF